MVERYKPIDAVGYKKPPKHTRFKKGQSGNPRGRPQEPVTVARMIAEELQSTVFVSENGTRIKLDKLRLFFKQAINQAIAGNTRPFVSTIRILSALEQLNQTPTKNRPKRDPLEGVDLSKLSLEELTKLYKATIAKSYDDNSS